MSPKRIRLSMKNKEQRLNERRIMKRGYRRRKSLEQIHERYSQGREVGRLFREDFQNSQNKGTSR